MFTWKGIFFSILCLCSGPPSGNYGYSPISWELCGALTKIFYLGFLISDSPGDLTVKTQVSQNQV